MTSIDFIFLLFISIKHYFFDPTFFINHLMINFLPKFNIQKGKSIGICDMRCLQSKARQEEKNLLVHGEETFEDSVLYQKLSTCVHSYTIIFLTIFYWIPSFIHVSQIFIANALER